MKIYNIEFRFSTTLNSDFLYYALQVYQKQTLYNILHILKMAIV